jgi:hypothetical protein
MNKKTSLLDQEQTIDLLAEFMKYARRGMVDVIELRSSNVVSEFSTQAILKMKEFKEFQHD